MRPTRDVLAAFEALPLTGIEGVLGGRRALILAPHPDDESLGCGGLIAASCAAGLPPAVVILTDGAASHPGSLSHPPAALARLREAETRQATKILGLPPENLFFLREPDTRLLADSGVIARLVEILQLRTCGVVIGPWHGDPHCDHEAAAIIAEDVAVLAGVTLLSYPVWGWLRDGNAMVTEPRTKGWRLAISENLDVKSQAIAAHKSQYGDLIDDTPDGFRLPTDLLAVFARPYEVYVGG